MKKSSELILLVALLVAAFVVPSLRAEQNPDRPEGAPSMGERREQIRDQVMKMMGQLDLSADQKAQVKELMMANGEEMKALMQDTSLDRVAKREKMMALRKDMEAKIDEILTPEQVAKKKELRASHGGPNANSDGPAKRKRKQAE